MGTEFVGPCLTDDGMDIPSIPPGFESLVPFTLKRVDDRQASSPSSVNTSEPQKNHLETVSDCNDDSNTIKSLRRRPGIKYNSLGNSSGDEYESEQQTFLRHQLPRGVIRGCEECLHCQKVTARWHPEAARRPDLEEAPVFYPSEEEFEDTLSYISSIRAKAEKYGICRIVPPSSWRPPCPLKERNTWERSKFTTRVQRVDKLQNRNSVRKILQVNHNKRRKKRRCMRNGGDSENGDEEIKCSGELGGYMAETFGFEPGPEFTLDAFQKYADDFRNQYFGINNNRSDSGGSRLLGEQWQPSIENIEGEYWRMVEKPTEEIEVLYGADLETGVFGSGFPKNSQHVGSASDMKYINSGWNLNNFPRLPGSVLSFESSDISGVLVPWLYIGMCFSSFCWHVEDHHLYSLNFMHWGDPKIWYGVPGYDAVKLEAAMRKHLPDLFEEQPDLLHKLITQLSPSILRTEGVPVYRCVQNPGEFVLTFPRAYHAGFNCGFNCAEAVNVAPVDWLPHGQTAIELYREQGRKTSISHDKLLLGAAREAVKANWEFNLLRKSTSNILRWKDVCGKEGIVSKALKTRVEMEQVRREVLCKSSQALKMESSFDANSERECSVCLFDLHLSAVGCHHCSPDKYACLNHAKQLCSCSWGAKFFLFRYDIHELNILVEALEGKLSAVYRWARLDLGLALSSYVSKDNMQTPGVVVKSSHASQGLGLKETSSLGPVVSSKDKKEQASSSGSSQMLKPPVVVLALANTKKTPALSSQRAEAAKNKKENSLLQASRNKAASCQLQFAEVNSSHKTSSTTDCHPGSEKPEGKKSIPGNKDVVLLSDDEGDESSKEPLLDNGTSKKYTGIIQKPVFPVNLAGLGSCNSDPTSTTTVASPSAMLERMKQGSSSERIKVEESAETGRFVRAKYPRISCFNREADSNTDAPRKKEAPDANDANPNADHKPQLIDDEKPYNEICHKNLELDCDSRTMDNLQTVSCNPSASQNILDRYYRPKGPRIAKVVRRINCNVELLEFGVVRAGNLWCDSRSIYPKGFRSRVKYIDVRDPNNMCYYVSEILDAGRDRPLFMVSVEHSPSEVFVHISAARCWEMVRERVNNEIAKLHKLGREKLPPLQPPGSLDGMEMFGFSSPEIVQVIQGMDQSRLCTEYWKSRPLMLIPQQPQSSNSNSINSKLESEPLNDEESRKDHPGVERTLIGLLNKANSQELHTLYSLLYRKNSTDEQSLLIRLLDEQMKQTAKMENS